MWENHKQKGLRNVIHVIPKDDLQEHEISIICWCNPRSEEVSHAKIMYSHYSLDGREHDEPDHDRVRCAFCVAYR